MIALVAYALVAIAAAPELGAPQKAEALHLEGRVLVLDVKAADADAALAGVATRAVAEALGARAGTTAISERELGALTESEKAKSTLDCGTSAECLAEVSRWADARFVVTGTLGRVGRTTTLTLSLSDAEAATVLARDGIVVDDDAQLPAAARTLVSRLCGDAPRAPAFAIAKGERASYAVFPVELQNMPDVDPSVARSLTDILAVEIKRVDGTTVVSIDDVAAMVSAEKNKSALTCSDDASCLAEIGAALDVDRLVVSSAARVAGTYVVSARLLDVKKVRVLSRVTESFVGPEEQLLRAVRHCARRLLGVTTPAKGALVVATPEVGARVFVDGEERGRTPTAPISELAPGRHALRVVQDGFLDWHGDVYVDGNETTAQWAPLEEKTTLFRPFLPEWTVYSLAGISGAALVGSGVTAGLMMWSQSEYDAIAADSVSNGSRDGESLVMPVWNRTVGFANATYVLLGVSAGAGLVAVATVPVVDFE